MSNNPCLLSSSSSSGIHEREPLAERIASADEYGTHIKYRRFMKEQAQYGSRTHDLGIGALDWISHVKAIQVMWLVRYNDGSQGTYKLILDLWLARSYIGRGAVFSSLPRSELTKATCHNYSHLPKFWRDAISALRTLPMQHNPPLACISADEAKALPFWYCPFFSINTRSAH